jgi:hypothetical protein
MMALASRSSPPLISEDTFGDLSGPDILFFWVVVRGADSIKLEGQTALLDGELGALSC